MDAGPTSDVSQTHPYTCNSCGVAFRNSDAQRTHMRSDWHRYNLKRKVAELPPVSSKDYNEKVVAAQTAVNATAAGAAFSRNCVACQKSYFSENAYQNHLASQKHKLRLAASEKGSVASSASVAGSIPTISQPPPSSDVSDPEAEAEFEKVVDGLKQTSISQASSDPLPRRPSRPTPSKAAQRGSDEHPLSPRPETATEVGSQIETAVAVPLSRCLFCNYDSPSPKLSLAHMTKIHGLFIPERDYLVDSDGLLSYLQAKIYQNYECLSCHKLKNTAAGVQTHMRDKGHCRIAFETEEEMIEVGQYYDFSSTYSDAEGEESDTEMEEVKPAANGGVKLPNGQGQLEQDDGWETDSSFSSLDSDDITSIPNDDHSGQYKRLSLHRHHSHTTARPHKSADGFHSHAHHRGAVFYDDNEMYLPSGRVAGHRSLKKYFRQNLHNYPTAAERMERAQRLLERGEDQDMADVDNEQPSRTQALTRRGEAGMIGASTAQRREVRSQEIRGRQQVQRAQNRYQAKVEKQANSQKHFRDPLLQ